MEVELSGSVALVLAAARGIGKAYCEALLDHGAKVFFCDIADDLGQATELELQQKYGKDRVRFMQCNCIYDDQLKAVFEEAKSHYGKIDLVINNCGIVDEVHWKMSKVLDVNFGVAISATELTMEMLRKDQGGPGGVVVHTSSNGALYRAALGPIYAGTKAAMVHYAKSISAPPLFAKHGIKMICLCPSMVATQLLKDANNPEKMKDLDIANSRMEELPRIMQPEEMGQCLIKVLKDKDIKNCAVYQLTPDNQGYAFKD